MDLFNLARGRALRDEGIERVEARSADFLDVVRTVALRLARRHPERVVTSDDLREWADEYGIQPSHPNAWGAVFKKAPGGYRWRQVGYRQTRLPQGHARVIRVWTPVPTEAAAVAA